MMRTVVDRAVVVSLIYLGITLVMTWPVAAGLERDIPGDLGDPAFVAGVMAWGGQHWLTLLSGDLGAAASFWNAPIFYPEPLATAYSEHFALHSLLTLPVYAVTHNAILCYNLWFLSTFVLGGLGMYLLVRDLTGRPGAAFVAGLAFAFAPYRVATLSHLQVLSSHWMPFVLVGLRRYFNSGSSDALLGAGAAIWAQNLSSGYYMVFFGPFVGLYALAEMWTRGLLRTLTVWRDMVATGAVAIAATMPFAMPYLMQRRGSRRPLYELELYSADLLGWLTASPLMNVWGGLQTFVKTEGSLFPGVTVVVLAAIGLWLSCKGPPDVPGQGGNERQRSRAVALFATLTLALSFWLSLGPMIQIGTHTNTFPALYRWAWEYLPGFGAARVPARFATITVLSLALLAGLGLSMFDSPRRRWLLGVCGVLLLAEGSAFPLPKNGTWTSVPTEFVPPEARLYRLEDAPPVFRYLRRLGDRTVVAHFPFGLPEREIQYGYYASLHGKRTVNGYSGSFPPSYNVRLAVLRNPFADPPSTQANLEGDRVTHIVVHTAAWVHDDGMRIIDLLERAGWRRVAQFDRDYILARDVPAITRQK